MKLYALILIICTGIFDRSLAQESQYYRLKGGSDPNKAMPVAKRYQYPAFARGKLHFKNGSFSEAVFNYNLLLGEMHFVSPKGDTLALSEDPTIELVSIGQDVFYYEYPKTFWRLLGSYSSVKLVSKQRLALIDTEKQGGYGQSSGTSSIRNTTMLSNSNGSLAKLNAQSDLVLSKRVDYGIMDQNNRFYVPKQGSILGLFPLKKQAIKTYLKENAINFNEEADLQKLLAFCVESP
ncbi:hypothetical protein [Spirosoma pollinicola]|uniref:Uncharacterized protein n=1 Tax=Spirosoma pollinicola TaxID=2057025 RepID=A0A2K8Z1W3_9BACT|nr:hypothetical protein [Spirosoma pollinicola]AUD03873.1 hypothetical protein CWM47_19825 [Spirosoma pollinicola]